MTGYETGVKVFFSFVAQTNVWANIARAQKSYLEPLGNALRVTRIQYQAELMNKKDEMAKGKGEKITTRTSLCNSNSMYVAANLGDKNDTAPQVTTTTIPEPHTKDSQSAIVLEIVLSTRLVRSHNLLSIFHITLFADWSVFRPFPIFQGKCAQTTFALN